MFRKGGTTSVRCTILVKSIQAKYLYEVIVDPKALDKFIPTSTAKLTKQGNISGLKKNLSNGRYKVVKGKMAKRLIDTSKRDTKRKTKRVIGLREEKKRKMIYDFYGEVDKGFRVVISDLRGIFVIKRN